MNAAKRSTLHLASRADMPAEVRRIEGESDAHYAKRCAAIHALGSRWLRHPQYVFDPRHSTNPEVWKPAFAAMWARVHERARAAREANPAFARAQAVRAAMGGE